MTMEECIKDVETALIGLLNSPPPKPFRLYLSRVWFEHRRKPKWYSQWYVHPWFKIRWMRHRNDHVWLMKKWCSEQQVEPVENQRLEKW